MSKNDERIHSAIAVCAGVILTGMEVVGKRTIFGKLKPFRQQIGWCFGFSDAATQALNLDQAEAAAFISLVFTKVYGKSGPKLVGCVISSQFDYEPEMSDGGQAYADWVRHKRPPLPPFSE